MSSMIDGFSRDELDLHMAKLISLAEKEGKDPVGLALLRTQVTIAPNFFSKLILVVNPISISCSNKRGNKILKWGYHPAECI